MLVKAAFGWPFLFINKMGLEININFATPLD